MPIRPSLLASTALGTIGAVSLVTPALSADIGSKVVKTTAFAPVQEPAVSGPNVKLEGFGGWRDGKTGFTSYGDGIGGVAGAFTIPLGTQFGLQIDGFAGSWGGDAFYGAGGHLFWRDPARGLLGLYANHMHLERGGWQWLGKGSGVGVSKFMAEGEYYWTHNVTLRGVVGWEGGDVDSRFTSKADLMWYATPDWKLAIGHRYTGGVNALALGTEYLTSWSLGAPTNRVSVFAEGRLGEDDYRGVWAGVRVYFGKSPTLVDKHRKDDPTDWLPDNLFTIQQTIRDLDVKNYNARPVGGGEGGGGEGGGEG